MLLKGREREGEVGEKIKGLYLGKLPVKALMMLLSYDLEVNKTMLQKLRGETPEIRVYCQIRVLSDTNPTCIYVKRFISL